MTWDTVQQIIRILAYAVGGAIFGDSVANGELFQGAVSGAVAIGAFGWWWFWERKRG